jgi:hypothetical protein
MPEVDVILPIVPTGFVPIGFGLPKLSAPIDCVLIVIGFVCKQFLYCKFFLSASVVPCFLNSPYTCIWSCYIAFPLSLLGMVQYTNVLLFRIKHCSKNMTSLSEYNGVLFLLNFFFLQSVQVGNITVSAWDPSVEKSIWDLPVWYR